MLTVTHVVTGAAIGSVVSDSPLDNGFALALGVISHYLLDTVPHWENWFGREIHGFESGTPLAKLPKITIISGVFDFILAIIVLYLLLRNFSLESTFWESALFWGAFGGFLPDLIDNVPIFNNVTAKIPGVRFERTFHEQVHIDDITRRSVPFWTGLITKIVVIALGITIFLAG